MKQSKRDKWNRRLLSIFRTGEEYSVKELVDRVGELFSSITIRKYLRSFEESGYVTQKRRGELGGTRFYSITDKGIEFVEAGRGGKGV